jgi:hypothetical protein
MKLAQVLLVFSLVISFAFAGKLYQWGFESNSALASSINFVDVSTSLASEASFVVGVTSEGTVYGWGENWKGNNFIIEYD